MTKKPQPPSIKMKLPDEIIKFLDEQNIVIVSTFDENENIHCSVKGIIGSEETEKIFIIDVYKKRTYKNLKRNPKVSITAVDEQKFKGYTLQGKAKLIIQQKISKNVLERYEERITRRISNRVIKGVQKCTKSSKHHEGELPILPKYLIEIAVEKIIDLSPPKAKK
ncbi:MAG: pyridoxamine 5'-phosphate oxidase family protein [Candidatus Omnitrophica bacterium]|nr:pyridoxamine 5'-phosphate oxidase family protein [Candidatus Omnitrophota bacterium]